MNSRRKGAAGEREAAKAFAAAVGLPAHTCHRGQQFKGGTDSPDIVTPLRDIHLEVKRVERGNPYDWMAGAIRDAGDRCPVVLHRRSNAPWLLIVRLSDVRRLAAEVSPQIEAVGGGPLPCDLSDPGVPQIPGSDG